MDYPGKLIRKTPLVPTLTSASGVWTMTDAMDAVKANSWPVAGVPMPMQQSLRFRSSATAYLNRTPILSNRQTYTWSGWVKLGKLTNTYGRSILFCSTDNGGANNFFSLSFETNSSLSGGYAPLRMLQYTSGAKVLDRQSTSIYRDPAAWYHVIMAVDMTQSTATNRQRVYVNGVEVTAWTNTTTLAQNTNTWINYNQSHQIGIWTDDTGTALDGYMAEVNFIDGQALTPSSFGRTDPETGVWQAIPYTGTFGTNGFYLPFKNPSSVGLDYSGNANNWTPNNISTTTGSTYDVMADVPTAWYPNSTLNGNANARGNYAVMNPLGGSSGGLQGTLTNGNLTWTSPTSDQKCVLSTISVNSETTKKWYWEVTATSKTSTYWAIGVFPYNINQYSATSGYAQYRSDGAIYVNGSNVTNVSSYTTGDIIGITFDSSNNQIAWYKNNSLQTTQTVGNTAGYAIYAGAGSDNSGGSNVNDFNFGQRPFAYTPPTGFVALNTYNLPTPSIGSTASTLANKNFDAAIWTGVSTSSAITISSLNFQPDLVWEKPRSLAYSHSLSDSVRGASNRLQSQATDAEQSNFTYGYTSSFNSNGFTASPGATNNENWNNTGSTYVAWCWKANGSAVSNTAGSITSQVSANTSAGFSVVTYTGTGSNATVGHGLGVAPAMIIVKRRNSTGSWDVYHQSVGNTKALFLNQTAAENTDIGYWNNTSPTSSVFTVGIGTEVNQNTGTYVAYCFSEIAGYSKFGSYTGNGSTDGTFVYTGFRPRFIMVKCSSNGSTNWFILDTARDTYNLAGQSLMPNLSNAEYTPASSGYFGDILSNGFKWRDASNNANNASGYTYIYMAFAESPFKNSLAR